MAEVEPGTRYVSQRGVHAGNEVEVVRETAGGQVIVRYVGGKGAGWTKAKSEAAGVHTLGRDQFNASYAPKGNLVTTTPKSGRAFRRARQFGNSQAAEAIEPSTVVAAVEAVATDNVVDLHSRPRDRVSASGLNIDVEMITPDKARAWLDRGGTNRKLSELRVSRVVAAIQRGEWQLTGEAIKLDGNGQVRDGQHRLEAIYRSGVPVMSVVVRGVVEDAFAVMDTGKSRSAADILGLHGIPSRNETASAARSLIIIERFGRMYVPRFADPAASPTAKEQLDYVRAHPELEHTVRLASHMTQNGFIGGGGLWATAITLLYRVDSKATEIFLDHLVEGDELKKGSPILKLRNMFRANYSAWDSSMKGRESLVALVVKGWNLWRHGDTSVQQLHWRSEGRGAEDFPVPE